MVRMFPRRRWEKGWNFWDNGIVSIRWPSGNCGRRESSGRIQKNESTRVDWEKRSGERRLTVVPSSFRNFLHCLPSFAHDRIDRFYFTAPLFSFNSYPGLIAFCRRRPVTMYFNGIHLQSAIDVTARAAQRMPRMRYRKSSAETGPMK